MASMTEELDVYLYLILINLNLNSHSDFPGGLVVKTSPSNAGGMGSMPGRGAKIPHDPTCLAAKKSKRKTEAIL